MVANHVFCDTDNVYHPTKSPQNHNEKATNRYSDLDIALVQLRDHIEYNNNLP